MQNILAKCRLMPFWSDYSHLFTLWKDYLKDFVYLLFASLTTNVLSSYTCQQVIRLILGSLKLEHIMHFVIKRRQSRKKFLHATLIFEKMSFKWKLNIFSLSYGIIARSGRQQVSAITQDRYLLLSLSNRYSWPEAITWFIFIMIT